MNLWLAINIKYFRLFLVSIDYQSCLFCDLSITTVVLSIDKQLWITSSFGSLLMFITRFESCVWWERLIGCHKVSGNFLNHDEINRSQIIRSAIRLTHHAPKQWKFIQTALSAHQISLLVPELFPIFAFILIDEITLRFCGFKSTSHSLRTRANKK